MSNLKSKNKGLNLNTKMEREIKFRGKTTGNPSFWVHGYFFKATYCDGKGECSFIKSDGNSGTEVIPDTVGQFTGLYDKNKKEIYEGDILRLPARTDYEKHTYNAYEVFWHDNNCCDNHIGWQMNRMHPRGSSAGGQIMYRMIPKHTKQLEIIENIHDNK